MKNSYIILSVGMIMFNPFSPDFVAASGVPHDFHFDLNELIDLSSAVISLSYCSDEVLLAAYKESFRTQNDCTYLRNWPLIGHRIFATIMPKYRNKPPLKYNLNDTQIVMALCFTATGTNAALPNRQYIGFRVCNFDQGYEGLRYVSLNLLPVALTQSRFAVSHVLNHVLYGGTQYYHPSQRIMMPPLWITGCSYAESIKQPNNCEAKKEESNSISIKNSEQQMPIRFFPQQSSTPTPQHGAQLPGTFITAQYTQPVFNNIIRTSNVINTSKTMVSPNISTPPPASSFPNASVSQTANGYAPP